MSTHSLSLAEEIADRIGIVDRGRLQCVGAIDELRSTSTPDKMSLEELFLKLTAGNGAVFAPRLAAGSDEDVA